MFKPGECNLYATYFMSDHTWLVTPLILIFLDSEREDRKITLISLPQIYAHMPDTCVVVSSLMKQVICDHLYIGCARALHDQC